MTDRKRFTKTIGVNLTYATFMVNLDSKDIIVSAPPIAKNWIGQPYSRMYLYYEKKGKLISTINL